VLITRAEVAGHAFLDVRLEGGRIAAMGRDLAPAPGEECLDAAGGALLPGLHDHHLHLFALAAADASVRCGPPAVADRAALAHALRTASPVAGWIRGIGYHETVAGDLDRRALDALAPDCPVRVQHRSGALWVVNSAGVAQLGLDAGSDARGVERGADGRATGKLYRLDAWLRERLGAAQSSAETPDLGEVSRRLASFGVTGITDATHSNAEAELAAFVAALERGELHQRLVVMGSEDLPAPEHPGAERGALKLVLAEHDLPPFDELESSIARAHAQDRSVAVHCVTLAELVLATAAFAAAGGRTGDRIEHASVAPPAVLERLAELPLTVVTQPHFIRERGDAYAVEVEPGDRLWLYRCRGFLEAGVPLGGGTDAPFGDPDPWRAMRAAVERRTEQGLVLGPDETLEPERALGLFTSPAEAPGAAPRRVGIGAAADLCLLDAPWQVARRELSSRRVRATLRQGSLIWQRG
jgi:predicted amidohydrolase YtcJ